MNQLALEAGTSPRQISEFAVKSELSFVSFLGSLPPPTSVMSLQALGKWSH